MQQHQILLARVLHPRFKVLSPALRALPVLHPCQGDTAGRQWQLLWPSVPHHLGALHLPPAKQTYRRDLLSGPFTP